MSKGGTAADRLRQIREERGLTRQRVAHDLDISERTLIRHEDGTTQLRRHHLLVYAEYFGISVDEITGKKRRAAAA